MCMSASSEGGRGGKKGNRKLKRLTGRDLLEFDKFAFRIRTGVSLRSKHDRSSESRLNFYFYRI